MNTKQAFVADGDISIRLMCEDMSDYELMAKWLGDERVLEFYGGRDSPLDIDGIREKYSPRVLREENVVPCIIVYRNEPVGYVQYYPVDEAGCGSYGIEPEQGVFGIDMFIGEPDQWNRGIGTRALTALTGWLFDSLGARKIVIDPHVSNHRAIRSYEKTGFKRVKVLQRHELHEGEYRDCWLMTMEINERKL